MLIKFLNLKAGDAKFKADRYIPTIDFLRPLKFFVLQTNSSEAKCLTVRHDSFTVFRMTTIDMKTVMPVCGLDVQVSLDHAVL